MVPNHLQLLFIVFFTVGAGAFSPAIAEIQTQTPIINLEQSVHFLTPGGDPVLVQAGVYAVESAEDWLRLIPQGHDRADSMLLEADVSQLDGLLDQPQALSQQMGKDQHLLALLLADGRRIQAEGSYSGVRTRAGLPRNRFMTRRPRPQITPPLSPLAKTGILPRVPPRATKPSKEPAKGVAPRITTVKGPDSNLVEQLLATVNCADAKATGLSSANCQKLKADLRNRLTGHRVMGNGTPNQRVNLYLAQGCPAKEDFRSRVAQEVAASLRSQLRITDGKPASRITALFHHFWQRASNVIIGSRGTFLSVLIVPAHSDGVNVAAPAGAACSNRALLPQPATPVGTPTPGSAAPPDSTPPPGSGLPGGTEPPPGTTPTPNSTPLPVSVSDFLARHNAVRANAIPAPTPPLPPLTWDQEIADVAQHWANQCVLGYDPNRGALGENLYVTTAQPNNLAEQAVQAWAADAPNYDLASNTCGTGTCGHYTQLVWESTTQLGCGAASCLNLQNFGTGTITVCNYRPPGNYNNQRPYSSVSVAESPPSENGSPTNTAPSPGATPLPQPTTFPDLQSAFLGYHNTVRSSVIPGPSIPLPSVTWNQQMANVAQSWANQCVLGYNAERGPVGENLFLRSGNSGDIALQAVQAWVAEAPHYDVASNTCAPGEICGHYTQVVWADTTQIGCAVASCPAVENFGAGPATIAVCDYSPRGNFNNQPPYDLN